MRRKPLVTMADLAWVAILSTVLLVTIGMGVSEGWVR